MFIAYSITDSAIEPAPKTQTDEVVPLPARYGAELSFGLSFTYSHGEGTLEAFLLGFHTGFSDASGYQPVPIL